MGHNVASAINSGRIDDYEESQSRTAGEAGDHDVSNWVPEFENSVLEELECSDPYSQRRVGEKEVKWRNKKCPSCKAGFNAKSRPNKCHGCDSFTHTKRACMKQGSKSSQFNCKLCAPADDSETTSKEASTSSSCMLKVENGWKCEKCALVVKTSYSMKRHIDRMHQEIAIEPAVETISQGSEKLMEDNPVEHSSLDDLLNHLKLEQYF